MNLKALITSLVLGSSSVALASPVSFGASAQVTASVGFGQAGPVVRDHRPAPIPPPVRPIYQPIVQPAPMPVRPVFQPPANDDCTNVRVGTTASEYIGPVAGRFGGWLNLTQPTRIEMGRELINLPANAGRFNTIQLRGAGGDTKIDSVLVQFKGGSYQFVHVNQTLCGNQTLNLDIPGRNQAVTRLVVYGSSERGARYTVSIA